MQNSLTTQLLYTNAVSVSEAKSKFSSLLKKVAKNKEVIIANHGKPEAAMISFVEYKDFVRLKNMEKRQEAVENLRRLAREVGEKNKDLTPKQVEAIAEELSDEIFTNLVKKGKITFSEESG